MRPRRRRWPHRAASCAIAPAVTITYPGGYSAVASSDGFSYTFWCYRTYVATIALDTTTGNIVFSGAVNGTLQNSAYESSSYVVAGHMIVSKSTYIATVAGPVANGQATLAPKTYDENNVPLTGTTAANLGARGSTSATLNRFDPYRGGGCIVGKPCGFHGVTHPQPLGGRVTWGDAGAIMAGGGAMIMALEIGMGPPGWFGNACTAMAIAFKLYRLK